MKNNRSGFSLIQIIIITGILLVLLTLATFASRSAFENSKIKKATNDLEMIKAAMGFMEIDTKEWPGHQLLNTVCTDLPGGCPSNNEICDDGCQNNILSGFAGITQNDPINPYPNWSGPYMNSIPLDPWGNQYFLDTDYDLNHNTPPRNWTAVIGSYGPNGNGNSDYDTDDIIIILAN